MNECCTLVVPSDSVLAKFAGQRVKIATVLDVFMKSDIPPDEKKLEARERSKRLYLRRKAARQAAQEICKTLKARE